METQTLTPAVPPTAAIPVIAQTVEPKVEPQPTASMAPAAMPVASPPLPAPQAPTAPAVAPAQAPMSDPLEEPRCDSPRYASRERSETRLIRPVICAVRLTPQLLVAAKAYKEATGRSMSSMGFEAITSHLARAGYFKAVGTPA